MTHHHNDLASHESQVPGRFSDAASDERRSQVIADLRELADFLEAHPDLPISPHTSVDLAYFPRTDHDSEAFAEVSRVGAVLGAMPTWEGEHLVVEHVRGSARYRVVAIPKKVRAQYRAWLTYTGHVRPD
ncbi:hypothetical protein KIK06_24725 [Nocardiopsis sp. EMB25]|uniref:hypothetical protein n=1 Tax=Nocardiopsis sp. EMB25 TaxID=2835867 RepID=UPI002284C0A3|nr:hypothetical protein [Nocardiopsis sp. EMB25]MCY9787093.1 hypothetical protein [Nocardiopsis sp. EMB25]